MREIKFRAWHKKEKKMYNLDFWSFLTDDISLHNFKGKYIPHISEVELMQYTGLKDKNGKECFEDDILLYKGYKGRVWYNKNVVRFFIDWEVPRSIELPQFNSSFSEWGKVIGNIYENPELLKL